MNNLNRIMLMLIAMAAIMLIAVGIDKGYDYYQEINNNKIVTKIIIKKHKKIQKKLNEFI